MELVRFEEEIKETHWMEAMREELRSIEKNQTWRLTPLPMGKKAIDVIWVYKELSIKILVAKGFQQRHDLDYYEVSALDSKLETIRLMVFLARYRCWPIH